MLSGLRYTAIVGLKFCILHCLVVLKSLNVIKFVLVYTGAIIHPLINVMMIPFVHHVQNLLKNFVMVVMKSVTPFPAGRLVFHVAISVKNS